MADRPAISVVIASFCGEPTLRRCLNRILEFAGDDVEVIAASNLSVADQRNCAVDFPTVCFIESEEAPSDDPRLVETRGFRLRSEGVRVAKGDIVALIEDHVITSPGWLESLRQAHAVEGRVVGGPVDPGATASVYVWALYLCEYVQLIRPMPRGVAAYISGVNASYRRQDLLDVEESWREAFFENEVNDALMAKGHTLWVEPEAWIESELLFPFKKARTHLHTGGWRFGCYRRERSSGAELLKWRITLPLVPLFHFWRILKVMLTRQPGKLGKLILGLPVVVTLIMAWSIGEARGLLGSGKTTDFGPPPADVRED